MRMFCLKFNRIFRSVERCYAGTLFVKHFVSNVACNFENNSQTNKPNGKKLSKSLVDFVNDIEAKSLEGHEDQNKIPKSWTKANKKGGVSAILQNSRPQILGMTEQQIEERLSLLESIGITGKDGLLIATELPSHFRLSASCFRVIGDLLNSFGCNLPKVIIKAPYIFGVDSRTLEANVQHLQSIGITNDIIGQAVDINPLIIVYPLSDCASKTIKLLLSLCEFDEGNAYRGHISDFRQIDRNEFALRLLMQPFNGVREQAFLGENYKQVAKFLYEIQVSPCLMVLNYPAFFQAEVEKLYEALEFFTGRPLLFETELIQKLLISKSEVFLNFNRKVFDNQVELLKGILKTPRQLYLLSQRYFFLQGEEFNLEHIIKILQKYNFQNEHIANILTAKDFYVSMESDIETKIKFLLSVEGITVDLIAEYSFCLLKSLKYLENRIKFAGEVKSEILRDLNMEMIFGTEDDEFITLICESTVEKYQESTGQEVLLKKMTPNKQRKRKKTFT